MADRVRALGTPGGLEVGQQVELAAVVGPVVMAASCRRPRYADLVYEVAQIAGLADG